MVFIIFIVVCQSSWLGIYTNYYRKQQIINQRSVVMIVVWRFMKVWAFRSLPHDLFSPYVVPLGVSGRSLGGSGLSCGLCAGSGSFGILLPFEIANDFNEELTKTCPIESFSLEIKHDLQLRLTLLMRLADPGEERMSQGLVDADAEVGVELQHAVEEVCAVAGGSRVLRGHVHSGDVCETPQVAECLSVRNV